MPGPGKAKLTVEKRGSPRLEVYLPVDYRVSRSARTSALSRDIAEGGIGLLLRRKVPSGTVLDMSIHVPGGSGVLKIRGEVIRCHEDKAAPERSYRWRAGLRFVEIETQATGVLKQIILLYNLQERTAARP